MKTFCQKFDFSSSSFVPELFIINDCFTFIGLTFNTDVTIRKKKHNVVKF